eukprot:768783-Amphidinium_carterae.1
MAAFNRYKKTKAGQFALQGAGEDEAQDLRRQWLLKRAASKNEVTQTSTRTLGRTSMQNRDGSLPNTGKQIQNESSERHSKWIDMQVKPAIPMVGRESRMEGVLLPKACHQAQTQ